MSLKTFIMRIVNTDRYVLLVSITGASSSDFPPEPTLVRLRGREIVDSKYK